RTASPQAGTHYKAPKLRIVAFILSRMLTNHRPEDSPGTVTGGPFHSVVTYKPRPSFPAARSGGEVSESRILPSRMTVPKNESARSAHTVNPTTSLQIAIFSLRCHPSTNIFISFCYPCSHLSFIAESPHVV